MQLSNYSPLVHSPKLLQFFPTHCKKLVNGDKSMCSILIGFWESDFCNITKSMIPIWRYYRIHRMRNGTPAIYVI